MQNTIWAKARYQYRSDTAENWGNANPAFVENIKAEERGNS